MKFLKIFFILMFVFAIAACNSKKSSIYEYPDDEPESKKGEVGDPCEKNGDCRDGLFCNDKVCSEPSATDDDTDSGNDGDNDDTDTDSGHDNDHTDTGSDDGGDSGHDNDHTDTVPDDGGDSGQDDDADSGDTSDTDTHEYIPECGNGKRDPGEECDNGDNNSDEPGNYSTCRTNCTKARCGDGIKDELETCDDGNSSTGDYCSPDCNAITGYCGDGKKQTNEVCDPGEGADRNPYCADDCQGVTGYCGDGIVNGDEPCDNAQPGEGSGEGIGPYYCNVNCTKIIGSCGDGVRQLNEACDDKELNGRYGKCNSTCSGKGPRCGDGNIDAGHEQCDDGNTEDGDYCSSDCQILHGSCGDGKILEGFEACDNATYGHGIGKYCSEDCLTHYGTCGDSIIREEAGEECDNGAGNDDNAPCPYSVTFSTCTVCSRTCKNINGVPRYCGDGVVSNLDGEKCDKADFGQGTGPHYCSSDCKEVIGSCGDGVKQPNEVCDPGIDPYCSADCKGSSGYCGDGTVNGNEQCDNAGDNGKTDCDYGEKTCTVCTTECTTQPGISHYCGNTVLDAGETCDDGRENGNYGKCNATCSGPGPHCGDGNIDSAAGEECDNSEDNGKTACQYGETSCYVCTTSCKQNNGTTAYCGDGKVNRENCEGFANCVVTPGVNETCDDGVNDGSYGHCGVNCYDKNEYCGDGTVNGNETCDDGTDNGKYGKCNETCSALGPHCGDKNVDEGEACDDGDGVNGTYSQNFPGNCNADCKGRGASGYCGDGTVNGGEDCDEKENNGQQPCAYGETSCKVCSSRCRLVNGVTSYCGDGMTNGSEVCDEGPGNNGDYNKPCNSECSGVPPKCGDGNTDSEFYEICDDKTNNGKYKFEKPGYCDSDCHGQGNDGGWCGDGIINGNEYCDDNELINGTYGGFCNERCNGLTAKCGDGNIDEGEFCDDYTLNGDYGFCNDDCTAILECGDGIVNGNEQCDNAGDNGTISSCNYGEESCTLCTAYCETFSGLTSYCGDKIVDPEHEACDEGKELNGTYGHCNNNCSGSMPKCGDGKIQRENCDGYTNCVVIEGLHVNEECDDAELNGTYGHCNSNCSAKLECGDGIIQHPEEFCDNGDPFNGTYGNCNDSCTAITGNCGDGFLQKADCGGEEECYEIPGADEECDKGYQNGNPACPYGDKSCYVCDGCRLIPGTVISYCGDDTVDGEHGELCDDGTQNGTFGKCDETCREEVTWRCGDGTVDFIHGESCDDSEEFNGIYQMSFPGHCDSDCKGKGKGGYCGDGKVQKASEDHCGSLTVCSETLTTQCCEIVQFAAGSVEEKCDDGGNNGTQGFCNETCDGQTHVCGNNIVEAGEACDDGEGNNGKYGKCSHDCNRINAGGYCGDGKIQKANADQCNALSLPPCDVNTTENCCEVVEFAEGDSPEACDEGRNTNGYHDHCNETCSGISSCGDGEIGRDEICDYLTGAGGTSAIFGDLNSCDNSGCDPYMECSVIPQFSGGHITQCDLTDCMPVLTNCVNKDSYIIPFFDTNQTLCYDNSASLACPAQTEDFYGQSPQFTYLTQNFEVNGEIVSETVSKTDWQYETPSSYEGCAAGTSCTLEEALAYCENSTFGGFDDWRLPSAFDFPIIADFEAVPHMRSEFSGTKNDFYWASEGLAFSTTDGTMTGGHTTAQVKCIRDENDKICKNCHYQPVFEYTSVLITASEETSVAIWYFGNPMIQDDWQAALAFCKGLDENGLNKMRLPTANELISLIDSTRGGSMIPGFAGTAWTSTTLSGSPANTSKAYVVNFSTLSLTTDDKVNSNYIICVE